MHRNHLFLPFFFSSSSEKHVSSSVLFHPPSFYFAADSKYSFFFYIHFPTRWLETDENFFEYRVRPIDFRLGWDDPFLTRSFNSILKRNVSDKIPIKRGGHFYQNIRISVLSVTRLTRFRYRCYCNFKILIPRCARRYFQGNADWAL